MVYNFQKGIEREYNVSKIRDFIMFYYKRYLHKWKGHRKGLVLLMVVSKQFK